MLAHGFGCDQNLWRLVAPVAGRGVSRGAVRPRRGGSVGSLGLADAERYATLHGYADDVLRDLPGAGPATMWCSSGTRSAR